MPDNNQQDPQQAVDALQQAAREFDLLSGEEGAGQSGGETFIQALQPFGTGAQGAPERQEGPQHKAVGGDPALIGITRNLKFAEALVSERKELDPSTRSFLQGQLGGEVGNVKVYTGQFADMAARALGAEAFAVERHVFFRSDAFRPGTSEGLGLLAHEVAHTMQSGGGRDERESEARSIQQQVAGRAGSSEGYGGGAQGDMELAMDQAPASGGGGGGAVDSSASAIPGEGKDEDEDVNPADTSRAPDEGKVFMILKRAVFDRLRETAEMAYTIHGVDV